MAEVLDDDALAELLLQNGFQDDVEGYFEATHVAGINRETARLKHTAYSIMTAHNRRILESDELVAIFRARNVPFEISDYTAFCAKYGKTPEEIYQRYFILEFINRCIPGKPLEEQKTWIRHLLGRKRKKQA